ncbi:GntR family transcriptional regulator [Fictibacillus sp. 5RED26]|jgi:DNA-binding GntR family transcriptional regulator|uniref:GntR family transcriptional regulator n=1 Tax=Fictibacillus sp. 5RED26 TaxID=2745876 RepID=UPI0018CE6D45|nr:GntR family transcriptional regulator [Fictibacillus sp. 5RED26]MBH0157383.1 GntR family transcriptional regulator [Fictibacillus sp. 5RED26]
MRKETVEQKVYHLIKNAILNRQIAPGNQLFENAIAQKVNASRTPIRSAIMKLESEGLVNVIPNKGAFIVQPTIEEMVQAFEMRKTLEEMAIKTGFSNLATEEVKELKQLLKEMKSAYKERKIVPYQEKNNEFHLVIAKASGNSYLIEFMKKILSQITTYMVLYDVFNGNSNNEELDILEHEQMIHFIENGEKENLRSLIDKHLDASLTKLQQDKLNYQSLTTLF